MSKKILSLVVAMLMLVSVFAVSASAFSTSDYPTKTSGDVWEMGVRLVSDAYVGMPAGETVTVRAFLVTPDAMDKNPHLCNVNVVYSDNFELKYDGTDTKTARTFSPFVAEFAKATSVVNNAAAMYTNAIKNVSTSERDTAILANYNIGVNKKAVCVMMTANTVDGVFTVANGMMNYDPYTELWSLTFTTTGTVTEDDIFCVMESDKTNTQLKYASGTTAPVNVSTTDNYWGAWGQAVANTVVMGETAACKMRPNAENAGNYDLGFTCTWKDVSIAGTNVDTSAGTTAIDAIGVDYRVNGTIVAGVANAADSTLKNQVYSIAGGYAFRSALKNIPAADMGEKIEARGYITVGGTTYYSQWQQINAATVKAAAHANGMA